MPLVVGGTQWEGYGQENINFFQLGGYRKEGKQTSSH